MEAQTVAQVMDMESDDKALWYVFTNLKPALCTLLQLSKSW
jgi:hypothetical protein